MVRTATAPLRELNPRRCQVPSTETPTSQTAGLEEADIMFIVSSFAIDADEVDGMEASCSHVNLGDSS